KQNVFPVTVTTLEKSELLFWEKDAFLELLQKNKLLLTNFLSMISDRSKFLSEKIGFLAFKTIKNKLAGFILRRANEQKQTHIILSETQQELADYFGVTRPSLARSLSLLEEEGLIRIDKKNITILDLDLLKDLAK
ncbi:MAG: Crp/Fnr family transcriptional regulator, partial [Bacteroidales bacterium]|nr:Crp/Fnr family transcriptional regulator [Bacteroidales bacterium]